MVDLAEQTDLATSDTSAVDAGRLVGDALLNAAAPIVVAAFSLFSVRLTFRGLDAEAYGAWIAALTLADSLSFLSLGLGRIITRHVARQPTPRGRDSFLEGAWIAHCSVGAVGAIVLIISGLFLPAWLGVAKSGNSWASSLFAAAALAFAANQMLSFCNEVLAGQHRFRVTNMVGVVFAAVRLAAVALIAIAGMTPLRIGLLHASLAIATLVTTLVILQPSRLGVRLLPRRVDMAGVSVHVRFGFLSQIVAALSAFTWQCGPLTLGFLFGPAAITAYYVGMRIPAVLLTGAWNITMVLFPAAASRHAQSLDQQRMLLRVGARTVVIALAPAVLMTALVPELLLRAWLGAVPEGAAFVLRVCSLAVLCDAVASSSVQLLWGTANMRRVVYGTAAAALVGGIGTLALARVGGVGGAALALTAAIATGGSFYVAAALRRTDYTLRRFVSDVFSGIIGPLAFAGAGIVGTMTAFHPSGLPAVVAIATGTCIVFYGLYWLRGATPEERALVIRARSRLWVR
ncbi:MAG TPA: hypothetical protein VE967_15475 [Gemmatimonadaceae bacterium]|nr:hypothetical protein [Gemmatimonadaceae bacterium]